MTIADVATQPTDAERFQHILDVQRAAYLRDGAPSLAARRKDLDNLKAALIARRVAIEEAINTDFGHRSRHETALMELVGVVQGIDYLRRNLRRFTSENLVPVTLELGGKSPTIVAKGHVTDQAVSDIVFGKLLSGGQTCIAPDYALVHESEIDTFVASYDRLVKATYPDGPTGGDYTSIVDDKQYKILTGLLEDARAHGARIIEVGHRPAEATRRPHTLAPTVVRGVTDDMRIAHEEIFGPVLPIFSYRAIDDAIDHVNARPRPLALYYFGDDGRDRRKVLDRTTSGNVTINGTIMHVAQDDLPFGGVGASGMGKYHGIEGFRTLTHPKGIYTQGRWNAARLLYVPFGKRTDALLNFFL